MSELTATGPVLVHFFDFAQLNSVRALALRARVEPALFPARPDASSASTRPGSVQRRARDGGRGRGGSGSSIRSPSTPTTRSGTTTAARAGRRCSSGAAAAPWPGRTSARASTGRPRRRSRRSCARSATSLELPSRWSPCARPTPGRPRRTPEQEVFPGRLAGRGLGAGPGDDLLELDYEAGGAYVVADGEGRARAGLDGAELGRLDAARAWRDRRASPRPRAPPPDDRGVARHSRLGGQLRAGHAVRYAKGSVARARVPGRSALVGNPSTGSAGRRSRSRWTSSRRSSRPSRRLVSSSWREERLDFARHRWACGGRCRPRAIRTAARWRS